MTKKNLKKQIEDLDELRKNVVQELKYSFLYGLIFGLFSFSN